MTAIPLDDGVLLGCGFLGHGILRHALMKKPDWQREALTAIKNQIPCFRNKKRSRSERMVEIMQPESTANPDQQTCYRGRAGDVKYPASLKRLSVIGHNLAGNLAQNIVSMPEEL